MSYQPRKRADGTVSHRVLYRQHGKQCTRTFTTKKAALDFDRRIKLEGVDQALAWLEQANAPAPKPQGMTLDEMAERFFAHKKTRMTVKAHKQYESEYRHRIAPMLGSRQVDTITASDVQDWIDSLTSRPATVVHFHTVLSSMFTFGLSGKRLYVALNPCRGTELPKVAKRQPQGLTPDEAKRLLEELAKRDADAVDLAAFLLFTGWRWSEAVALGKHDVHDENGIVRVAMERVDRAGEGIVEDGKTETSGRITTLTPDTAALIRRRRDAQRLPGGLIFTTGRGKAWRANNFRRRLWLPAVEAAGLTHRRPTVHWLRHTHVSWMSTYGRANLAELSRRLGHASTSFTFDRYGRWISDVQPEALEAFDRVLAPLPPARRYSADELTVIRQAEQILGRRLIDRREILALESGSG